MLSGLSNGLSEILHRACAFHPAFDRVSSDNQPAEGLSGQIHSYARL